MNPLELADRLRTDYRRFTWTTYPVANPALREQLETLVDQDALLWNGPYLSVQPRYREDIRLGELASQIGLPREIVAAFPSVERLFAHQVDAIRRIHQGRNTLVATGTGSGKTESFLIPVVAHAHANRHRRGVKAIALYPMNALVNDQEYRFQVACAQLGLRYGVYTGATPQADRDRMQENPPDILLTNYSMLEYLLTRRGDRELFGDGLLRHLVLDEVHTYQGALGTEIACLVRRLRGHVDTGGLVCMGLSATVSAGGDREENLARTATFASNLFGSPFERDAIVEETAEPTPQPDPTRIGPPPDPTALREALTTGADPDALLRVLGDPNDSALLDFLRVELAEPRTVAELVDRVCALPARANVDRSLVHDEAAGWLLLGAGTKTPAGYPVLEAKVHLFLRSLPQLVRCAGEGGHLLLDGADQCSRSECDGTVTASLGVCLGCGQDYDLVSPADGPVSHLVARSLHTDPVEEARPKSRTWYPSRRCISCGKINNNEKCFGCGAATMEVTVAEPSEDKPLTRCPVCGYGRSGGAVQQFSARTAAAITAVAFSLHSGLSEQNRDPMLRRLLVFADSRQDTAFQAGYLKDRARATQVRRLIVQAVRRREKIGDPPASFDGLVRDVHLAGQEIDLYESPPGLDAQKQVLRVCQWDVLNEVASAERRPPTLERLGLVTVGYPGLDQLTNDDLGELAEPLGPSTADLRWFLVRVLDLVRTKGGVGHDLLRTKLDASDRELLTEAGATVRMGQNVVGFGYTTSNNAGVISMSDRGAVARLAKIAFPNLVSGDAKERAVKSAILFLGDHGLLVQTPVGAGKARSLVWQLAPQAMEVRAPAQTIHRCGACRAVQPSTSPRNKCGTFNCRGVMTPWSSDDKDYERALADGVDPLMVAAEEHSGQIPLDEREQIEERFKNGDLNLLVCTMTLELGVDLGQLLAVVLRNVPPRPSNYAQRAGRAGRREERVALIVTFAGGMPHDSYYYQRPVEMIRGAIRPPTFLLDNERVITRHARALALELCGEDLPKYMENLVSSEPEGVLQGVELVRDALKADTDNIANTIHTTFRHGLANDELRWLTRTWANGVVESWIDDLDEAVTPFRVKQKALLEEWQLAIAKGPSGQDVTRAIATITASLQAMRKSDRMRAYTLSYLSLVGFLPSYAFPTDTASLVLEREIQELSQDSIQALKDYAPGQLVYARGTRWFVDRVDFRRASLVDAEGSGAIPQANLCRKCDTINDHRSASCEACDSDQLTPLTTVPMRAMRATRRQRISADEEQRSRQPFDVTHHLGAPNRIESVLFERPGLVLQWERSASLTVLNKGRVSPQGGPVQQFIICRSCGLWFDAYPGGKETETQRKRSKRHEETCAKPDLQSSVLFTERSVDCLQILPDLESLNVQAAQLQEFLASIRAALDLGCRVVLQAGEDEVTGFDWPRPDPGGDDALLRLAVLYEQVPGGAGYLRQLAERFGEVAAALVPVLDECFCDSSCYACLRSYSNQLEGKLLDRRVAADFLRRFVNAPAPAVRKVRPFAESFDGQPRSPLERRLALALIDANAPRGHAQYMWDDRVVVDFAWPEHRVAVFCDGWEHHNTEKGKTAEKATRDTLREDDWAVLTFWGGEIVRDANACADRVLQTLAERA